MSTRNSQAGLDGLKVSLFSPRCTDVHLPSSLLQRRPKPGERRRRPEPQQGAPRALPRRAPGGGPGSGLVPSEGSLLALGLGLGRAVGWGNLPLRSGGLALLLWR